MVATMPATTGLASPSSEISVGGKGSERGDTLQNMKLGWNNAASMYSGETIFDPLLILDICPLKRNYQPIILIVGLFEQWETE